MKNSELEALGMKLRTTIYLDSKMYRSIKNKLEKTGETFSDVIQVLLKSWLEGEERCGDCAHQHSDLNTQDEICDYCLNYKRQDVNLEA
jgi:hypothetical protein